MISHAICQDLRTTHPFLIPNMFFKSCVICSLTREEEEERDVLPLTSEEDTRPSPIVSVLSDSRGED